MKEIFDIYSVVKEICHTLNIDALTIHIQNIDRLQDAMRNSQNAGSEPARQVVNGIISEIKKVNTALWTADHFEVAERLEIGNLIGKKGEQYFSSINSSLISNPKGWSGVLSTIKNDLTRLKTKPFQLLSLLEPFKLESTIEVLDENTGIIEITFDGKVSIEDFKEAKDQMADWFLIIEGYAKLLNTTREDFEIFSITKSSPTKIKVKTTLTNVSLFLSIAVSLVTIEKTFLDRKMLIETLKEQEVTTDPNIQKKFLEDAEKKFTEKVDKEINKVVDQKIKEYKVPDGNGDIRNNFSKGVHNQYNFINNGGSINIHIINGQMKEQVDSLEKTKEEVKKMKQGYENQKALTSNNENIETDETIEE